jgi:hypothetical protein
MKSLVMDSSKLLTYFISLESKNYNFRKMKEDSYKNSQTRATMTCNFMYVLSEVFFFIQFSEQLCIIDFFLQEI